jgi:hypothetical protein
VVAPKPITERRTRLEQTWGITAPPQDVVEFACNFGRPFWATFAVDGDTRSIAVGDITIVEMFTGSDAASYGYSAAGVPGISDYAGRFAVSQVGDLAVLSWTTTFVASDGPSLVHMLTINAGAAVPMTENLAMRFDSAASAG